MIVVGFEFVAEQAQPHVCFFFEWDIRVSAPRLTVFALVIDCHLSLTPVGDSRINIAKPLAFYISTPADTRAFTKSSSSQQAQRQIRGRMRRILAPMETCVVGSSAWSI
jgi:hypothetical protein